MNREKELPRGLWVESELALSFEFLGVRSDSSRPFLLLHSMASRLNRTEKSP